MIDALSAPERKIVAKLHSKYRADLSRDAYFRMQLKELADTSDARTVAERYSENLGFRLTPTEADAVSIGYLYSIDLVERGVARRISKNSPAELAAALSLASRFHWLTCCAPGRMIIDKSDDAWFILQALAAGDTECACAYFGSNPRRLPNGNDAQVLLYNALLAVLTKNTKVQKALTDPLGYSAAPLPIRALHSTLLGIITDDAELVGDALRQVLKTFRRLKTYGANPLPHETIISLHCHGLVELAYWKSPELLAEFETGQDLPWDNKYYRFLRKPKRTSAFLDLSKHSTQLTRWITQLKEPQWWSKPLRRR